MKSLHRSLLIVCLLFLNISILSFISKNIESKDFDQQNELDNHFITNNNLDYGFDKSKSPSNNKVWSEPYQITFPLLESGDYKIVRKNGVFHSILAKKLSLYGFGFYHMYSQNGLAANWTNPEQIIQRDSQLIEFKFSIDSNGTIHLAFITSRESVWQISYLQKYTNETFWREECLTKSFVNEYRNIEILLIKNNIQLYWLAIEANTEKENLNSSISYTTKNLITNNWGVIKTLYNSMNPVSFNLNLLQSNDTLIVFAKWDTAFIGNDIYYAVTENKGTTWINLTLIQNFSDEIGLMHIYPSLKINGFHVILETVDFPIEIYHLEAYFNGTIYSSTFNINSISSEGHFGGMFENETSGDILVFYEGVKSGLNDLYIRIRNGTDLSWLTPTALTINGKSRDPIFILNQQDSEIGQLYYTNYNILASGWVFNNETLLNEQLVLQFTENNGVGSIAVDSNKTVHYTWQHLGAYDNKIFYVSKYENETYDLHGCITESSITSAGSPKLLVDSNDTLYCFFIADEIISSFTGLYYTYKYSGQSNWSKAELVKTPESYAQRDNYQAIIDNADTIHIVWSETAGIFRNRLLYSYKMSFEESFTSEEIIYNDYSISSFQPDLVFDSFGTLHLVYSRQNRGEYINFITYHYKNPSQNWSDSVYIAASTSELFQEPEIICDSNNDLTMIFLSKFQNGPYFVSDSILMLKSYGNNWQQNVTLFSNEVTNFHDLVLTENDTIMYIQQIDNIPFDTIPDDSSDVVLISQKEVDQGWSIREEIARNLDYEFDPAGIYDNKSKTMYIVVRDKLGNTRNIHIISQQNDNDGDLLGNEDEKLFNTNPNQVDSDLDGINDGAEVSQYYTHPKLNDTDFDNIEDGDEILVYQSNPLTIDTDADNLIDGDEVLIWNTSPILDDTDGDTLSDFDEIFVYGTNPINSDTDFDGIPDFWEIENNLNPILNDSLNDNDDDNLTNIEEYWYGTNPLLNDTDLDDLLDGDEIKTYKTNPLNLDTDEDSLSDSDEILLLGTNPLLPDSDFDGYTDREEINAGTDPNNPRDNVRRNRIRTIILGSVLPIVSLFSIYSVLEIRYRIKIKKLHEKEKLTHEDELRN
jgi:hypothetical protein